MSLLTVKEAAAFLRMAPGTLYRKVEARELPAVRIGGRGKILALVPARRAPVGYCR